VKKTIKEINDSTREVEFEFSKEDLQPHFDKAYKKAQPLIDMKGFRKGRVPISLIKKHFGKRIEAEALEEISNDAFQNFIKEDKIEMIGTPKLSDIKEEDSGYTFKIEYEVFPKFELADYKSIKIYEPVHPVSDEEIEHQINLILRNNGDIEPADFVTDELFIVDATFNLLDPETNEPSKNAKPQRTKLFLADETILPELKTLLINTKVGDNFEFEPSKYDSQSPQGKYKIVIEGIEKLIPKKLNDDFVKQYTKEKFSTVDEFKEEIGFQLQEKWDEKTRIELENQIITKLVEMHNFDLPKSVVKDVIDAMYSDIKNQYYKNVNLDEKLLYDTITPDLVPLAERTVKWEFIKNAIIKLESLELDDSDIEEIVNHEYNSTGGDKEAIKSKIKSNKQIVDRIISKKVIDFLIDFAETEEISFDEYHELMHNHEHNHEHEYEHEHEHEYEHEHELEYEHEHEYDQEHENDDKYVNDTNENKDNNE